MQFSGDLFVVVVVVESLEERDRCFKDPKSDFPIYIQKPLSEQHRAILTQALEKWLSTLMSEKLALLIQKAPCLSQVLGSFLSALKSSSTLTRLSSDPEHLSMSLVPRDESMPAQRFLHIFYMIPALEERAPSFDDAMRASDGQRVVGFFAQHALDLQCIRICCTALRELMSPSGKIDMRSL